MDNQVVHPAIFHDTPPLGPWRYISFTLDASGHFEFPSGVVAPHMIRAVAIRVRGAHFPPG